MFIDVSENKPRIPAVPAAGILGFQCRQSLTIGQSRNLLITITLTLFLTRKHTPYCSLDANIGRMSENCPPVRPLRCNLPIQNVN